MNRLSGKTAVVTGASKGIGAGIAKGLAAEGAAVVINYASSKDGAERVVADIKAKGGKAIAVQGDVAKAADVEKIFAETKQAFGRLDILVNNAGVYNLLPLEEVTEEDFHRHFNINVLGLLLATKEAAKLFGDEGGSVINIGSVASDLTPPNSVVYTATKGAVDAVTRVLAKELGSEENSGQLDQSGRGRNRGHTCCGRHRQRSREAICRADAARADRTAGRYSAGRGVLGVGRVALGHRRYAGGFGGHWAKAITPL